MKKLTEEVIRVRFLREGRAPSRPKKIRKIIYENNEGTKQATVYYSIQSPATPNRIFNKEGEIVKEGLMVTRLSISALTFITEWEKGPTPTTRPIRRYNDEKLQEMGYSMTAINEIRGRTYRAKDVKTIYNKLKGALDNRKIRKLLEDHDGSIIAVMETANQYVEKRSDVRNRRKQERKAKIAAEKAKELKLNPPLVEADTNLKEAA